MDGSVHNNFTVGIPEKETEKKVLMGTCGWSDVTLMKCGRFYPPSVKSAEDRLRHYSTFFSCVEVDTSCYAIPLVKSVNRWIQSVPSGFKFHFKAFGLFCSKSCPFSALPSVVKQSFENSTVEYVSLSDISLNQQSTIWRIFNDALRPVLKSGRLGLVVFQFHLNFAPNAANVSHVEWCRRNLDPEFSMAAEFRCRDWITGPQLTETCDWLKGLGIVLVAADELKHETFQKDRNQTGLQPGQARETLPTALQVTSPSCCYIRIHRREGKFRILKDSELESWSRRIKSLKDSTLQGPVYFMWGTDHEDQPIVNAKNLSKILKESSFQWKEWRKSQQSQSALGQFLRSNLNKSEACTDIGGAFLDNSKQSEYSKDQSKMKSQLKCGSSCEVGVNAGAEVPCEVSVCGVMDTNGRVYQQLINDKRVNDSVKKRRTAHGKQLTRPLSFYFDRT